MTQDNNNTVDPQGSALTTPTNDEGSPNDNAMDVLATLIPGQAGETVNPNTNEESESVIPTPEGEETQTQPTPSIDSLQAQLEAAIEARRTLETERIQNRQQLDEYERASNAARQEALIRQTAQEAAQETARFRTELEAQGYDSSVANNVLDRYEQVRQREAYVTQVANRFAEVMEQKAQWAADLSASSNGQVSVRDLLQYDTQEEMTNFARGATSTNEEILRLRAEVEQLKSNMVTPQSFAGNTGAVDNATNTDENWFFNDWAKGTVQATPETVARAKAIGQRMGLPV